MVGKRKAATSRHAKEQLTGREKQIVLHLRDGLSNKELAVRLRLQPKTVANHLTKIYKKLGVRDRFEASETTRDLD